MAIAQLYQSEFHRSEHLTNEYLIIEKSNWFRHRICQEMIHHLLLQTLLQVRRCSLS
ncbi:hypothetical protein BofuT4_uP096000.1 [Botrytis cinerea T4]|uniref:Uncharacterized protein n=1 Tax=Botryotinia fuckeliana (strain T4) TaxID=999810 RepID=G2YDP4_BOTF4|nr:hypothetical protein BofuT4_uP096000.1 [Botrytis cinerea T4]